MKSGSSIGQSIRERKGVVDIAIIKNRVWDIVKEKYPGFEKIGEDKVENPNSALMASYNADKNIIKKLKTVLLGLEDDSSAEAIQLKKDMGIKGFILTQEKDFEQTLALLKKAGLSKSPGSVIHENPQGSFRKKSDK